mmetsp:Transcript_29684/g.90833  ORF Transcript_29684/g.90833 Transcript_29684/m.90833 type:complete len:233 (+) Transcript_29684:192-890(+)
MGRRRNYEVARRSSSVAFIAGVVVVVVAASDVGCCCVARAAVSLALASARWVLRGCRGGRASGATDVAQARRRLFSPPHSSRRPRKRVISWRALVHSLVRASFSSRMASTFCFFLRRERRAWTLFRSRNRRFRSSESSSFSSVVSTFSTFFGAASSVAFPPPNTDKLTSDRISNLRGKPFASFFQNLVTTQPKGKKASFFVVVVAQTRRRLRSCGRRPRTDDSAAVFSDSAF